MMWQDFVFLLGSSLSIVFLAPTLRDRAACVPLATSLPSMGIGAVYAATFWSLGMTFSAAGSLAAATMWTLIAYYRSPDTHAPTSTHRNRLRLFADDFVRWTSRRLVGETSLEQYEMDPDTDWGIHRQREGYGMSEQTHVDVGD